MARCHACLRIGQNGGPDSPWWAQCVRARNHDGDHHFDVHASDEDILTYDLYVDWIETEHAN